MSPRIAPLALSLLAFTGCVDDFPEFANDSGIRVRDALPPPSRDQSTGTPDTHVRDAAPDRGRLPDADPPDGRHPDARVPPDADAPADAALLPPDTGPPPRDAAVPDAAVAETRYLWVDVGADHSCAIRQNGTIVCWGEPGDGRLAAPPGSFQKLTLGEAHGCAYGDLVFPVCWGRDDGGSTMPPPFTLYAKIEAGRLTTCGLSFLGELTCWGDDYHRVISDIPDDLFLTFSLSWQHVCAVNLGGVVCWGDSHDRRLIDDPTGIAVAAGYRHSCVTDSNLRTYCLGAPDDGPALGFLEYFTELSAGGGHTCGIRDDQHLVCWGTNGNGQATPPEGLFTQVAAGDEHTCALRIDGAVLCWGKNDKGQTDVP